MTLGTRSWMLVAAALLLGAGPAGAQGVVADKSEIKFVSKQMGVNVEGRFRRWNANIVFLPNAPAKSRAEFDIDLSSVDLASDDSEAEIKKPEWFDAKKFPAARFSSTSVKAVGGDKYEVAGKLSLRGVTRDCLVPITVKKDSAGNSVAEGTFTVKRLDYNIGAVGLWADPDTVANDVLVQVRITLAAT